VQINAGIPSPSKVDAARYSVFGSVSLWLDFEFWRGTNSCVSRDPGRLRTNVNHFRAGKNDLHLLTESEPFSEHFGGALSRWTANVLRDDEEFRNRLSVADASWNFPSQRIVALKSLRNIQALDLFFSQALVRAISPRSFEADTEPAHGETPRRDVLYIHNRPEYALALQSRCRHIAVKWFCTCKIPTSPIFSKRA